MLTASGPYIAQSSIFLDSVDSVQSRKSCRTEDSSAVYSGHSKLFVALVKVVQGPCWGSVEQGAFFARPYAFPTKRISQKLKVLPIDSQAFSGL